MVCSSVCTLFTYQPLTTRTRDVLDSHGNSHIYIPVSHLVYIHVLTEFQCPNNSCKGASLGSSKIAMLTVTFVMFAAATVCVILDIFITLRNISRAIDPTIGGIADDISADIADNIQSALSRVLVRCQHNLPVILALIL